MKILSFVILKKDRLVAETICRSLEEIGYKSFGYFTQPELAVSAALAHQPDFFLTEVDLPGIDGYTIIQQVKQLVKVDCIIRTSAQRRYFRDALNTNVSGYLHATESGIDELTLCLQTIKQGKRYISPSIALPLSTTAVQDHPELSNLTERDRAVLQKLAKGTDNEKIAQTLHMSIHTLNSYLGQLKSKLNVGSTRELVVRSVYISHWLID